MSAKQGQQRHALSLLLLIMAASALVPASAQHAQINVDETAVDWAYPVKDPLRVMPPPVLADLPLPANAGVSVPSDCEPIVSAWGETSAEQAPEMSLQDAIDLAICRNPELRQNRAMVQNAAASLGLAQAAYWPSASASVSRVEQFQYYDRANVNDDHVFATSKNLALNWRLYDFGQRERKALSQVKQVQAATASMTAAVRKILMDVAQQYFTAQNAAALLTAREHTVRLAGQMLQSTLNRQSKGLADQSEVLQARSARARAEYDLSISRGEAAKAKAALGYVVGLQGAARFRLPPSEAEAILNERAELTNRWAELDAWLSTTKNSHPAIAAAQAQVESAQHNVLAIKLEGMPSIDLSWNQYENGRPNQSVTGAPSTERTTALTLRIPLFDGFSQTYKVRAAQAQLEQKRAELAATEAQVLKDALSLHAEAGAALANLKAAQQLAFAAQQATESLQRKYDQGAADLLQMNQSLSALTQARSELVKCWTEWQAARLKLVLNHSLINSQLGVTS